MTNISKIRKKAQEYEEGLCDDYLDNTPQNQLIWEHYEAGAKAVIAEIRERLKPHLANYEDKQKRNAIILYKTIETILKEIEK